METVLPRKRAACRLRRPLRCRRLHDRYDRCIFRWLFSSDSIVIAIFCACSRRIVRDCPSPHTVIRHCGCAFQHRTTALRLTCHERVRGTAGVCNVADGPLVSHARFGGYPLACCGLPFAAPAMSSSSRSCSTEKESGALLCFNSGRAPVVRRDYPAICLKIAMARATEAVCS